MKTRWGHGGTEPHHQVIRLEHDGARTVLPRALERELEPAVGAPLEPVLRDGRTGDVAAQPLELPSVTAVDALAYIPGNEGVAPWLGRRATRSAVAEYARLLFGSSRPVSANVHRLFVDGDGAVVTGEFVTEMTATGRLMESPFSAEFTVRGGQISRYRLLEDSYALVRALS